MIISFLLYYIVDEREGAWRKLILSQFCVEEMKIAQNSYEFHHILRQFINSGKLNSKLCL
jgi:hypothetical protein